MRIVWCTRSFLDYRLPVFAELDKLSGGALFLLYSASYVPERVHQKAQALLGERAIGLLGEWKIGREDREFMANRNLSLRFQPGLRKRIRELKPDCLIGDGFFKWTLPCLLEQRRGKTPLLVCYERTAHTERNVQWFRRCYRSWALRHIDVMCCNGSLSADYVASLGFPRQNIRLGNMAADSAELSLKCQNIGTEQKESLRRQLRLPKTLLLFVGRLLPLKGLHCLLEAWAMLPPGERQDSALLLVGDGPQRQELEAQCQSLGIAEQVRFAGAVDYDEIAQYYALADTFVIPTLEDNWSLVVPEAMACSLPILSSKYNGCWPELVKAENGWVFDPLHREQFAAVLSEALRNRQRWPQMGLASKRIEAEHSPQTVARSIFQACELAVQRK